MVGTEATPGLVQIGETLRTARGVRGLSLDQAAATLHCDVRVIDAIEHGRFEELGPPVFARGHLLRYAALLGEPGEAMVEEWSQLAAGGTGAELMRGIHGPRGRDLRQVRRRLVIAAALLACVAIAAWSLQNLPQESRVADKTAAVAAGQPAVPRPAAGALRAEPTPGAPVPVVGAPAAEPRAVAAAAALAPDAPRPAAPLPTAGATRVAATTSAPAASRALSPSAQSPALPRGVVQISLTFSANSWVEIYDSRNRRLFFGLARPGAPVDVRGPAPLRVIVGNAPAATVELNGRRVEVPPEAMRGPRAAALRVNADGRLRALPRA